MYFVKTPGIIQSIFSGLIWRVAHSKKVYLTFDDGPVPEATIWVLDTLKENNCKATFFCVGDNVKKYPMIYQRILDEGHSVGNHTYNHLNAWENKRNLYTENVEKASSLIDSSLFRPPYGKLTPSLIHQLKKEYDIIMWDVLSGDFDTSISAEQCFENVKNYTKEGSIIVFHDSIKAIHTLRHVLPQVIAYFKKKGIQMDRLKM